MFIEQKKKQENNNIINEGNKKQQNQCVDNFKGLSWKQYSRTEFKELRTGKMSNTDHITKSQGSLHPTASFPSNLRFNKDYIM